MLPGASPEGLRLLLGRAFLIALEKEDRKTAMLFARALLTQLPASPQRR